MSDAGPSNLSKTEEFVLLLGKSQQQIYAFVLSLVSDASEAEEIVQDAQLVLWRRFADFERGTDFTRWACQVAYFKVLKQRDRIRGRVNYLPDDLLDTMAAEATEETDAVNRERDALANCLERLPASQRQLVHLRYQADATTQSIAAQVGRSVSAVYKALSGIHWRLFECVRDRLALEDRT